MTTDRDTTTRIVRSWLQTDEHESADRVLDSVLDRLDTTPQRRATPWSVRRLPQMNNTAKLAMGAAAVVVAALLGIGFLLPGGPDIGGPGPSPTPVPTALSAPDLNDQDGSLAPGSYSVERPNHLITFTVPPGWTKNRVASVVWSDNSEVRVGFGGLSDLHADPCRPELGFVTPEIGGTAEDLATALAAIPGVEASTSEATLSGFEGRRVDLVVPAPFGDCIEQGGEAMLNSELPLEPGMHSFWVLDVNGTRAVVQAVVRTNASESQARQVEAIVNSVRISAR
jgi:hypothetical protein